MLCKKTVTQRSRSTGALWLVDVDVRSLGRLHARCIEPVECTGPVRLRIAKQGQAVVALQRALQIEAIHSYRWGGGVLNYLH